MSQGYQYVYLPSRHKDSYRNLRSKLTMLKVNNWRVLDIHFPAACVVALLVHNDYVSELTAVFAKAGVMPLVDFNPLDPKHLDDPRLSSLSASDAAGKACLVHQGRLLCTLQYIRSPACNAVAADFCARGWIADEQLHEFRKTSSFAVVSPFDASGAVSAVSGKQVFDVEDLDMHDSVDQVPTPSASTPADAGESVSAQ